MTEENSLVTLLYGQTSRRRSPAQNLPYDSVAGIPKGSSCTLPTFFYLHPLPHSPFPFTKALGKMVDYTTDVRLFPSGDPI